MTSSGAAVGRGLSGFVCDRFGRFNTMASIMAITTVFIFVIWYPFGHYVGVLYAFVVLMGFGTGAILCLIPVCIAQMCKTEEVGQWLGNCYLIISHGYVLFYLFFSSTAANPYISGLLWQFPLVASYSRLLDHQTW